MKIPGGKTFNPTQFYKLRTFHKLGFSQLSELVGVTPQALRNIEAGRNAPSAETLGKMSEQFSVPVDFFFDWSEEA